MLHLKTKDKTMKTGLLGASAALVIFIGGGRGRGRVPLYLSDRDRATFPRGWCFQTKDLTTGLVSTP